MVLLDREACAWCALFIKHKTFEECLRYFAVFLFYQKGGGVPETIKKLKVFEFLLITVLLMLNFQSNVLGTLLHFYFDQ